MAALFKALTARATPRPRTRALRGLLSASLVALLAGCATVQTTGSSVAIAPDATASVDPGRWTFESDRPAAERDGYRPPRKLAVLLPMSGSLATAAAPVRDGERYRPARSARRRRHRVWPGNRCPAAGGPVPGRWRWRAGGRW